MKSIHTDKELVIAGGSSDADAFANELKELAKVMIESSLLDLYRVSY